MASAGTPMAASSPISVESAKEIVTLREGLQKANTKNKRLNEVYTKMVQDFRDSCYLMTGFDITVRNTSQYRLTSMYAEDPEDSLLFQNNGSGNMQMLHTDFAMEMLEHAKKFLQRGASIPAFLSSVTLDLFDRTTMMQ